MVAALGGLEVIPQGIPIQGIQVIADILTFAIAMTYILLRDLWLGWKGQQKTSAEFEAS